MPFYKNDAFEYAAALIAYPPEDAVLNAAGVIDLMGDAVQRRGTDFKYEPVWVAGPHYLTCLYAHDGHPDCIVGEVLHEAGVDIPTLESFRDEGIRELWFDKRLPICVTFGAVLVMHRAQVAQDRGDCWGTALASAEALLADLSDMLPWRC